MNCKKAQSYFFDYIDATVDQRMQSEIDSHLSSCSICREYWETQRRLQQSVKSAADVELAGLHFQPKPIPARVPGTERRPLFRMLVGRAAYAMPALLLLFIIFWPFLKPGPRLLEDPDQSAFAEAYRYLEMYSADKPGASSFAMPMAVIIQPDAPARVIELDGKIDISAALK